MHGVSVKRLPWHLRAREAPVEWLGWLLFPGHFVLALLLLQQYFAPLERGWMNFRAPSQSCTPGWVLAALLTAAIATCPTRVSLRRVPRASLALVVGTMFACGYATLLVCAVVRVLLMMGTSRLIFAAATFGIPAALVATLPFALLDLPVFVVARRLQRGLTCEDTDKLAGLAGLHMLAVTGLAQLATSLSDAELWQTPVGRGASMALLFGGAALVLFSGFRIAMRARFIARVRRGMVPRYEVGASPSGLPLPGLTRRAS